MNDKLPPHSKGAEKSILGQLLRAPWLIPEVISIGLQVDDFYGQAHQIVFAAIVGLSDQGKTPDLVQVCEWIAAEKKVEDAEPGYVAEIFSEGAQSVYTVVDLAHIIRANASKREVIHACAEIQVDAFDPSIPADELLDMAERKILAIADRSIVGEQVTLQQAISESYERLDRRRGREDIDGVASGFIDLDTLTSGFQASELVVVAARPSVGKSQFALVTASHAASCAKEPVLFISLEQKRVELADRLLCSTARVSSYDMRRGKISPEDETRIIDAGDELGRLPLIIDDTFNQNVLRIAAGARRLKQKKGLRMVIIDYLQLIDAEDKRAPRQEQVSSISRRLKGLARDLDVPVIALAQLNREVENRVGGRPKLSDLRESGAIEQDADTVIFLHRQTADDDLPSWPIDVIVSKQRNGPTGEVKLLYVRRHMRFENFAVEHQGKMQ